jgi:hypothetical protein
MKVFTVLVILICSAFVYFHTVEWLIISWLQHPYYKQGFVVLGFSLLTGIWRYRQNKKPLGENYLFIPFIILSSGLFLSGYCTGMMFLQALSLFFTLLTVIFLLGSYLPAKDLAAPACLLLRN